MSLMRITSQMLLALLFLGISMVSNLQAVQANQRQIPQHEYRVLEVLYDATNGETWHKIWELPTDIPCALYGVTCARGHIAKLDLGMNNLRGSIPPALGNLAHLRELALHENELEGPIPPELGNLGRLEQLVLGGNRLRGSIPPELGNLNNLVALDLGYNELTGPIPGELGSLSKLERLDLKHNQLSGSIPSDLDDTGDDPVEIFPSELTGPVTLQRLPWDRDQPGGAILPELESLTELEYLPLNRNQFEGAIPIELASLTKLQHLDLSYNQLSGPIPVELASLADLQHLCVTNNQLSGEIPQALGNLDELRYLGLASNHLTGAIPVELANLTNLEELALLSNQLEGTIPPELGNLTNLRRLSLQFNWFTGTIPPELGQLRNLQHLDLRGNSLSGIIPPTLGNLTDLRDLRLRYNSIRGPLPHSITNLTLLGVQLYSWHTPDVYLGNNQIWTHDPEIESFLDSKDPNWRSTQNVRVAVVDPEEGGVVHWTGTPGQAATIVVPAGVLTESTTLAYYPLAGAVDLPAPFSYAGRRFDLQAYRDDQPLANLALREPVMVTLTYKDCEVAGLDETTLRLYLRQGNRWVDAAMTCTPSAAYYRDPAANLLRVEICHLSSFALAGMLNPLDD